MSSRPDASIIIPVLNGEATLPSLFAALKSQAGGRNFEIIVVDNGSTDRTCELTAAQAGIQLLHQSIRGPAAARNLGLAHAQGEVVLCTDSDCVPCRRWLISLLRVFQDPAAVLATGPIFGWQPATGAERYASSHRGYTRERSAEHPVCPFAHGMNVAVRRAAAGAVGGWDEAMTSGEDVDFSIRLRKRFNAPIHFVEDAVVFHKHRSTDEALWKQARWHGAGYAMVRRRHAKELPWMGWQLGVGLGFTGILHAAAPLVALGRYAGWFSEQQAEFERYHRRWLRCFWGGFLAQWIKHPA